MSSPTTFPPRLFQRVLNDSHTTFVYSSTRSQRKYARRQPRVLYAYSASIALSVGEPVYVLNVSGPTICLPMPGAPAQVIARIPLPFAARAPGAPRSASHIGTTICAPFSITSRAAVADRLRSDFASTWMILILRPRTPPAALICATAISMPLLIASSKGASAPVRLLAVPITIGSFGSVAEPDAPAPIAAVTTTPAAARSNNRLMARPPLQIAARNGQPSSRPPVRPRGRKIRIASITSASATSRSPGLSGDAARSRDRLLPRPGAGIPRRLRSRASRRRLRPGSSCRRSRASRSSGT